ncbi:MAG: tetratricopeptide repeat protein [Opitutae bacterium]
MKTIRCFPWLPVMLVLLVGGPAGLRAADDTEAQFNLAQKLEAQKKYAEAETVYSKLIEANLLEQSLYTRRGWVRHLQKNEKGALADLDMADMMKPNDPATLFRRGQVHLTLDDPDKAEKDFTVVATADPKNARVRYELATTLSRTGRNREALAAISEAITLEPQRAVYVMLRAVLHEKLGEGGPALADADQARTLTSDPKLLAMIDKNRPRLAALAANPKHEIQAGGLLPNGRPDPAKARAAALAQAAANAAQLETLPPAPPAPELQVKFPERIDFRRLSKSDFRAAVAMAMEQMRVVLGPRTAEENAAFEKTWAPALDFPCEPVVEYLNRLNPLLARFLSLRAAVGYGLDQFNASWEEAMTAAGYGAPAGADALLGQARAYGEQLRAMRDDLAKVSAAIAALGDPPNATNLKKHRRKQADAAVQYVQDVVNGDLWTQLHACDAVRFKFLGRLATHNVGNVPRGNMAAWELDYAAHDERRSTWKERLADNSAISSVKLGHVPYVAVGPYRDEGEVFSIEWLGPVFFASRKFAYGETTNDARYQGGQELSFCGVFSEDGHRLIDFYYIASAQQINHPDNPTSATLAGSLTSAENLRMLHLSGDKLRKVDNWRDGSAKGLWYAASDNQGGKMETEPGDTAAMLKQYYCHLTYSFKGTNKEDAPIDTHDTVEVENVQLTDVEFRFYSGAWYHGVQPYDLSYPDKYYSPDEFRAAFAASTVPWNKIITAGSKDELAMRKLEKLANLVRSAADEQALDAYRQAAAQVKKDGEAKQRDIATYGNDIKSIEEYLGTVRAQRDRAAQASPRDATLVKELDFRIIGQESEVRAKQDLIDSLTTGTLMHTATPFDNMCRAQAELAAQADVDRLAASDRGRRANAALQARLDESERRDFVQKTGAMLDAGGGMDPAKWHEVNAGAYTLVQAKLGADKNAADAATTAWERKVWAAQATATAADFTFGLLSGAGGYRAAGLAYSFTTSSLNNGLGSYYESGSAQAGLKAGLFEGTKSVVTSLSDTIDYAWNAVDAYHQEPQASFHDRLQSVVTATGSKWLMSKATGYVSDALTANLDLSQPAAQWKPSVKESMAAARHQQQMEMDQALARDFLDTYKQHRTAQLRGGDTYSPELERLAAEVRRKACSVNSSLGAKVYMKTQALPVEQRAYSRVIDDVHAELVPRFHEQMAAGQGPKDPTGRTVGRWGGHELAPIRNASSAGTASMDFDLALRQQPDWVPDGSGGVRRNAWLTRNGEPASPHEFQEEGQRVWNQLYRQATGYSATTSFENITTLNHPEAYRDLAWTKITRGPNGEVRGTDALDWRWAQQAGDVTRVKHYEMLDKQPNLDHYSKLQESCRGTAKDIKSKVTTLLDDIAKTKGGSMNVDDRQHLEEVRTFWNRVQEVTSDFGLGKMPALEAQRQIFLLSGGRGLDDLTDRVGTVIESLGKMKKKK